MPTTTRLAYREGNRIRHSTGKGYGDLVPDSDIVKHAIEHMDSGEFADARWCLAVLDVRIAERRAVAERLTR